jgi:hypothetical protein
MMPKTTESRSGKLLVYGPEGEFQPDGPQPIRVRTKKVTVRDRLAKVLRKAASKLSP